MKEAGCPSLEKAATYSHQDSVEEIEEALIQATKECIDYDAISQSDYTGITIFTRLLMRSLTKKILLLENCILQLRKKILLHPTRPPHY